MQAQYETRQEKNQQRAADPASEVSSSKFCRCFGYISCSECAQDCIVECNFCALCCNCSRCLAGTCQCMKHIGCIRFAEKCGFSNECINHWCRKDSPLCKMIFNGMPVMFAAVIAMCYAGYMANTFMARSQAAEELDKDYKCYELTPLTDQAGVIKEAMDTAGVVYTLLAGGCVFSCIGGPLNVMRWCAIPFHLLPGFFMHMFALYTLAMARYSEAGEKCAEVLGQPKAATAATKGPIEVDAPEEEVVNQAAADVVFIGDTLMMACVMGFVFTLLASVGCFQQMMWNRLEQQKQLEQRIQFRNKQREDLKKQVDDRNEKFRTQAQLENAD